MLPVFLDRPASVPYRGGTVYISVHDQMYLARMANWKFRLAQAHPDKGGTSKKFIYLMHLRDRWLEEEEAWYAQYGLKPPSSIKRVAYAPSNWEEVLMKPVLHRVLAVLRDGKPHLRKELAKTIGIDPRYAAVAIKRLRHRGYPIVTARKEGYILQSDTPTRRIPHIQDGGKGKRTAQVLRFLEDGMWHDGRELDLKFGHTIRSTIYRLRQRGFDIRMEASVTGGRWFGYRLVALPERLRRSS